MILSRSQWRSCWCFCGEFGSVLFDLYEDLLLELWSKMRELDSCWRWFPPVGSGDRREETGALGQGESVEEIAESEDQSRLHERLPAYGGIEKVRLVTDLPAIGREVVHCW